MLSELETQLGYRFRDRTLLENALTHSSYANEHRQASNERLEFLGDSVLGVVVADYLYRTYPDQPEGELTRTRAELVCERTLARVASSIGLGEFLHLGHGEQQRGGSTRPSITADAVEALIAAAYLDGGFDAARGIICRLILGDASNLGRNKDYKTQLQELVQQEKNQVLAYELVGESGPNHDKRFDVRVTRNGIAVGEGSGHSKKAAEQAAACAAIQTLFPDAE